jgi:hypothetical protein
MATTDNADPLMGPDRIYQIMTQARSARSKQFRIVVIALMKKIGSSAAQFASPRLATG